MINRRIVLAGAAALAFTASAASAQDWKAKYPELTFAVVPAENASGVTERWTPFVAYLSKELGVKVTLRIANDYAAVIEGQRSGNIQIASYGSASFARARLTGVKTDAFANDINADGSTGYYSMFFVKASSPYKSIDQLKGKNLGLVDPNSTSGNNVPRFELDKMGISDADTYFGKVVFTGSHENAMLALAQGTVDVAANQWTSDDDSTLAQMLHKGMLKNADGTPMKKEDFRIIHKSAQIINGPYAYNSELPEDLKAAIAKAFAESPDQGQGRLRPAVRRPEEGLPSRHDQGLGRDHRPDQVRRQSAQEEGVLSDRQRLDRPGPVATRPFSVLDLTKAAGTMTVAVSILPEQQLAVLNDAYRKAVARKRLRLTLATAVFFAALVIAAIGAEVNLRTFFTYFGNFVSYFDRIFTLENGARVWTDIGEWFWGWRKWLWMLGETILISYVGTLSGAILAFVAQFFRG